MMLASKRMIIVVFSLFLALVLLMPGCVFAPSNPEPSSSSGWSPSQASAISMSKAPRVGETVDLTFTLDVPDWINLKPINKVWLEFERYDPALWYPLGRGDIKDEILRKLSKKTSDDPSYFVLTESIKNQPESLVTAESVLVSGNISWEGERLPQGQQLRFSASVRFPEAGEWVIIARWQSGDGWPFILREFKLTVGEDSGTFGWQEDYSLLHGLPHSRNPDQWGPVGVLIKPPKAPRVGEPWEITVTVWAINDVPNALVELDLRKMDGSRANAVPPEELKLDGDFPWQGSLKKDVSLELKATLIFPEEGDWQVGGFGTAISDKKLGRLADAIPLHVSKDSGRFGWNENHEWTESEQRRIDEEAVP